MQQETMLTSPPPAKFTTDLIKPPSYSSIFFHSKTSPTAGSPNTTTTASSHSHSQPIPTPQRPQAGSHSASAAAISSLSRLMTEHQELLKKHAMCLIQLEKTFKEAETLRQENTNLRMANADLSSQLSLMIQFYLQGHLYDKEKNNENEKEDMLFSPNKPDALFLSGSGEKRESNGGWDDEFLKTSSPEVRVKEDSPGLVQGQNGSAGSGGGEGGKVSLPKSISVRSSNYMKINTGSPSGTGGSGGGGGGSGGVISGVGRRSTRVKAPKPADSAGPQKVYVRGGSKKDGPIELDVYNQGMLKTELCNKWEETGTCPYGDHCQFAHGIGELRPVIRHPRYKTEVCRMVLNGDPCPYGHRCHFRHALTEQEKNMIPLRMA